MNKTWHEVDPQIFFSKEDPQDPRLGNIAKAIHLEDIPRSGNSLLLWGYPDDEGIRLNGGRPGANFAPLEIRKFFYKMTPPLLQNNSFPIFDLGNLATTTSLQERHLQGALLAEKASLLNGPWISLGGGHDYGFADGFGFLKAWSEGKERPLIINIDAHLDVRPTDKGFNSGTPFRRLLESFPGKFDFFEIGIQSQCNSRIHLDWLKQKGGKIISLNQIRQLDLISCLNQEIKKQTSLNQNTPVWLSLDIDGITSNEAPGCSQSWTTGLTCNEIFEMFHWLKQESRWQSLSIYEVSPPLDSDSRTSKLAALFAHKFYELASST